MINNTTTGKAVLPHFAFCVLIFSLVLFSVGMIYFQDIHLPTFTTKDFVFKEFLFYTFGIKLIGYVFKIIFIGAIFYLGAFLFKVIDLSYSEVLKAAFLAEIVNLFYDLLAIIWFNINPENLSKNAVTGFGDNFSLNGLFSYTNDNLLYNLLNYFGVFEIIYILVLSKLLNSLSDVKYLKTLSWVGITYVSYAVILSLVQILVTF